MTIKMLLFKTISAAFGGGPTFDQSTLNPFTQLAGARASGGQVYGGRAYLVGERGPELFMPKFSGSIVPNNRINFANDDTPMMPSVHLTMHNDFSGVDASSVARIETRLDQMQAELPARVLATMGDARDRFVWKGK
jgi:phage-related minor tail protein